MTISIHDGISTSNEIETNPLPSDLPIHDGIFTSNEIETNPLPRDLHVCESA